MAKQFPRTMVGGVSMPRMLIGTNWILGYSHKSDADDKMIACRNDNAEAVAAQMEVYLKYGIDAMVGPMANHEGKPSSIVEGAKLIEQRTGKKIILIDTPMLDITDSEQGRKNAALQIKRSKEIGATFCLLHTDCTEQLVNKHTRTIDRLPDYLSMMRENGLIPGFASHVPEAHQYSDEQGYDVETYIMVWNLHGFYMQKEIESYYTVLHNCKNPVMTIKAMAAGRLTPLAGITWSYNTIREQDMVTIGAFTPEEAEEDIEIGFAAIEHTPIESLVNKKSLMKVPNSVPTE